MNGRRKERTSSKSRAGCARGEGPASALRKHHSGAQAHLPGLRLESEAPKRLKRSVPPPTRGSRVLDRPRRALTGIESPRRISLHQHGEPELQARPLRRAATGSESVVGQGGERKYGPWRRGATSWSKVLNSWPALPSTTADRDSSRRPVDRTSPSLRPKELEPHPGPLRRVRTPCRNRQPRLL